MSTMPTTEELTTLEALAKRLFAGKAFPDTVRSVDTAFAILLKGWELGMPAMAAAAGIAIVSGKVSLGADATAGACLRHRDICLYFSLVESTGELARYETHRANAPKPVTLTYTLAQAKTAGLTGSSTWQKHAPAMLRARCAAALARAVYPDLVAGCYDPDEAAEIRGDVRPVETPASDPRDLAPLGVEAPAQVAVAQPVETAPLAFATPGLSAAEMTAMLATIAQCTTIADLDRERDAMRPDVSTRATTAQRTTLRKAAEAKRAALTPQPPPTGTDSPAGARNDAATGDDTHAEAAPSAEAQASIARVGDPHAYLASKSTYTEVQRAVMAHGRHVPGLCDAAVARLEALDAGDEANRRRIVETWRDEGAHREQRATTTAAKVRRAA